MTHQTKPILTGKIDITVLIAACLIGLAVIPASHAQTNQIGGMDDALTSATTVQRDPFWPIGYTPTEPVKKVVGQSGKIDKKVVGQSGKIDWYKAMKQVEIQGVSSRAGNEFFAVINGNIKGAEETVSVQVDGVGYTWMIESISPPSSVKLRRVSAQ